MAIFFNLLAMISALNLARFQMIKWTIFSFYLFRRCPFAFLVIGPGITLKNLDNYVFTNYRHNENLVPAQNDDIYDEVNTYNTVIHKSQYNIEHLGGVWIIA